MQVLGRVAARPPNHDLGTLLVPLENRAGSDTKPAPNLGWHRDLTLGGDARLGKCHGSLVPR
jgi:hypothetical protein